MNRPSISLACILKNEVHNLPRFLESVKDCFDEIHLTDTGSTDGSIALIESYQQDPKTNPAQSPIFLHHFTWVDDFSAARNASFAPVKTDYVMWLDLDDVLSDAKAFISYRDSVMNLADFWLATYHYGTDEGGKPNCSFARERVIKTSLGLKWNYFVHEGMIPHAPGKTVETQYALTWNVVHKRTKDDLAQDKSRNLKLFEKNLGKLNPRMRYYYGKELFENQKPLEAFSELMNAISESDLELHDRIMGIQYAALSAMQLNQFDKAVSLAHQGLQIAPNRAEFFVILGDCNIKMERLKDAAPFYRAATECEYTGNNLMAGPLFSHQDSYHHYPLNQLARIYANTERIEKADEAIGKAMAAGVNSETIGIYTEIQSLKDRLAFTHQRPRTKTSDIVVTCHPQGPYEWDGESYRQKGIGGSETAAVEVAEWLHKLTGRKVLVFNNRTETKEVNGVTYEPVLKAAIYFTDNEPALHVAWRHNIKLTNAPTYLWCHDLGVPGLLNTGTYEKVLALSHFHASYLKNLYAVPASKILITANGIEPKRFEGAPVEKTPNKVVFSSSPDRGLDRAIYVMDEVVKQVPDATLHVYYGFDNLLTAGRKDEAARLDAMIRARPYVKYHGNLEQKELTRELKSACVWLYPTNFLETFCITALEMLACGVYPIVREYGALKDTLALAHLRGNALLMPENCESKEEISAYAKEVLFALEHKLWEGIEFNPHDYSWKKVAETWVSQLLKEEKNAVELSA